MAKRFTGKHCGLRLSRHSMDRPFHNAELAFAKERLPPAASVPSAEFRLPFKRHDKVIELGGGGQPLFRPNVDMRWLPTVDIVCSFNFPLPVESESYDGVFCKFAVEHLSWRRVRGFLSEAHRILKPGGIAVFVTANLLEQCRALVEAEEWNDGLICMVFGDQDYPENTHRCGFSPEYAEKLFKEAGFYQVKILPWPGAATDMMVEARKSEAVMV